MRVSVSMYASPSLRAACALFALWIVSEWSSGCLHMTILNNVLIRYGLGSLSLQTLLESHGLTASSAECPQTMEHANVSSFWASSRQHTVPVLLRGALAGSAALGSWNTSRLARLFPEASLGVERRIDPAQPDGSFAERLASFDAHQLNQVLCHGVRVYAHAHTHVCAHVYHTLIRMHMPMHVSACICTR